MLAFPIGTFPGWGSDYVPPASESGKVSVLARAANFGTTETFLWLMEDRLPLQIGSYFEGEGRFSVTANTSGVALAELYPSADIRAAGGALGTYSLVLLNTYGQIIRTYTGIEIGATGGTATLSGNSLTVVP